MQSFEEFSKDFETKQVLTLCHSLTADVGTAVEVYPKLKPLEPFALISRFGSTETPRIALMAITRRYNTLSEASAALGTLQGECNRGFCLGFIPFESFYAHFPEKLPESDEPIVLYHPQLILTLSCSKSYKRSRRYSPRILYENIAKS